MTTILFLQCIGMGLLGQLLHVLVKYRSLRKRTLAANGAMSFGQFLKDDYLGIIISVIALLISAIGLDEIAAYKPAILNWVKWFYSFIGFTGSSLVLAFFSKSEKALLKVIDKKTNIADGKESDGKE